MKTQYAQFIHGQNVEGSNKASSYIRALTLLDEILRNTPLFGFDGFWSIDSPDSVSKLYEYALEYQKQEGSVFLQDGLPPSYGQNGYYSAALKNFGQFLVVHGYEQLLWGVYQAGNLSADELAAKLSRKQVKSIELLIDDPGLDFQSREGIDVKRSTKARLGQDFFRKMILSQYQTQCCITGLNVPEVLRASHIVGWADDSKNRLNPANGLCLSATYDAAFDKHLISFDESYRMILSPTLKEYYSNRAFQDYFQSLEGQKLVLPNRFEPDPALLEKHRLKLVA